MTVNLNDFTVYSKSDGKMGGDNIFIIKNIMSKRLLITEEEKNRIKSLYETTTPPPSESVLVKKQNPLSKEGYKEFYGKPIPEYNANLKDGDIFVVYDEIKIKEWGLKLINNNLKGKSIRLVCENGGCGDEEDQLITIPEFIIMYLNTSVFQNPEFRANLIFNSIDDSGPYREAKISLYYDGKIRTYSEHKSSRYPYTKKHYNKHVSDSSATNKIKDILYPLLNWEVVPNEFFEIRKIERLKTDF
jgi:hypothetical protein